MTGWMANCGWLQSLKWRSRREVGHFVGAYQNWQKDDASLMAASVAYYLGLSFFPVLLVLIAGLGLFFNYTAAGRNAEEQVLATVGSQFSYGVREQAKQALENVKDKSELTGPIGLAGIVLAALAGFAQFDKAFDKIWNIPPPADSGIVAGIRRVVVQRGVAFLMLLGMGTLVIVVLLTGIVISSFEKYAEGLLPFTEWLVKLARVSATLGLNTVLFTLMYHLLPKTTVRWREALRGGVVVAIAWEIGRFVLASILIGSRYSSAYGVVGSFIAIQLWFYYAMAILFFGAEYIQEFCRHCQVVAPEKQLVIEEHTTRDRNSAGQLHV